MFFDSPLSLQALTSIPHKLDNAAAIWMEEVVNNHVISSKALNSLCHFIYVVREPEPVLNLLVQKKTYTPLKAVRYYCYRLRRICEMARSTPGAVFLTWEDIKTGRGNNLVENYLKLKTPLERSILLEENKFDLVPYDLQQEAQSSYEHYLYFLRNQNLQMVK